MIDSELNSPAKGYRIRQRYVMPAILILGAIVFSWWTSNQEAARRVRINNRLQAACAEIIREVKPNDYQFAGVLMNYDGLREVLLEVLGDVSDPGSVRIEVVTGDDSPFADRQATHSARIIVEGKSSLGLRLVCTPDDVLNVIGFWRPDGG